MKSEEIKSKCNSESVSSGLLSCPYCGSKMLFRESKMRIMFDYVIKCSGGVDCPVQPYVQGNSFEELKERINTRAV